MNRRVFVVMAALPLLAVGVALAIDGYTDTPMLPGGKWHVHDPNRPQPAIVTPGTFSTQETPGKPPSDAIVLFDGTDVSKWKGGNGQDCPWKIDNGAMVAVAKAGDVQTRDEFGDCQLHVEFSEPTPAKGSGQGRGNSGVFLMGRFEFQVLDCYGNQTYPDGQTGSLYGQFPPLVNACLPPGEWQTYDIVFTAPRFDGDKLTAPAYVTAFHNGVLVQNHTPYLGPTNHRVRTPYKPQPMTGPIRLQDHGNPVRYRNIWIRAIAEQEHPELTTTFDTKQ